MPPITRTLGPLHFEDLEPHRFEDLVRAILYDFRQWQKLEATGRGGSDDGFDVRGWEIELTDLGGDAPQEEADGTLDSAGPSRLWLIQCKREKSITPKKLIDYLNEIPKDQRAELNGIIFAAACDFSKKSRDAFIKWCQTEKISECFLWGKADLEGFLLLPKNDSILFAFFGVSLTVRRRSLKTELRTRLATKKRIIKLVGRAGDRVHKTCLFRDPADERYPEVPKGVVLNPARGKFGYNWFARAITEVRHDGILIRLRDRMAYLADDGIHWDSIAIADMAVPGRDENPWEHPDNFRTEVERERDARLFWQQLPDRNRARHEVWAFIEYDSILAVDEDGDGITDLPVIFVPFDSSYGPFKWGGTIIEGDGRQVYNDLDKRVDLFFPNIFPKAEPWQQPVDDVKE